MGIYVNRTSKGPIVGSKVKALVADGAEIVGINIVPTFEENMVVVVKNGDFEAAAYATSLRDYEYYIRPDGRDKTYLVYDKVKLYAE